MATTSRPNLQSQLTTFFNDIAPTKTPEQAAITMAQIIDDYVIDVVSKITGASSTSASSLFTPVVIVPLDGGASATASFATNAATPLAGTVSSLTTN